jgi:hypothetical protein
MIYSINHIYCASRRGGCKPSSIVVIAVIVLALSRQCWPFPHWTIVPSSNNPIRIPVPIDRPVHAPGSHCYRAIPDSTFCSSERPRRSRWRRLPSDCHRRLRMPDVVRNVQLLPKAEVVHVRGRPRCRPGPTAAVRNRTRPGEGGRLARGTCATLAKLTGSVGVCQPSNSLNDSRALIVGAPGQGMASSGMMVLSC